MNFVGSMKKVVWFTFYIQIGSLNEKVCVFGHATPCMHPPGRRMHKSHSLFDGPSVGCGHDRALQTARYFLPISRKTKTHKFFHWTIFYLIFSCLVAFSPVDNLGTKIYRNSRNYELDRGVWIWYTAVNTIADIRPTGYWVASRPKVGGGFIFVCKKHHYVFASIICNSIP